MATKKSYEPCEPGKKCGFIATERSRFFTGKFMTARDFRTDQGYFLSRHRMHNRLLHGWGIVCGLRVTPHPDPDCADSWVMVGPGIAIDCCGRELILEKAKAVKVWDPPESPGQSLTPLTEADLAEFLICIQYDEKEVEFVPVMDLEGACDPNHQEANRIREQVILESRDPGKVAENCWPASEGSMEECCRDDCDTDLPGPAGICLEPDCPCGECVPLALVKPALVPPPQSATGYLITENEIDSSGRRQLPVPPKFLTHIGGINWPHGGEVNLSCLNDDMEGQLKIKFDRKLLPIDNGATGINTYTFIVRYGGVQHHIEFLPYEEHPKLNEEQCTAIFAIDKDYLPTPLGTGKYSLVENTVYVTLKCDFVLDCHGNPVDGNHLRGQLPSGDGVPGGTFESWFRIVHDETEEQK